MKLAIAILLGLWLGLGIYMATKLELGDCRQQTLGCLSGNINI